MRKILIVLLMPLLLMDCAASKQFSLCKKLSSMGHQEKTPLPPLDSLQGRRVCIDPGHGGPWSGAVAPSNGLRECDVNLAVALRLGELLAQAGAEVALTRSTNEALVPDSLSGDLRARIDFAHAHDAEVFISIHHNADIKKRSRKNDLEVYYNLQDDGPSLDLAQCLTYELAQGVRQKAKAKRLLPGNYNVLRRAKIPAVLIEASYLTRRRNARRLKHAETVAAEARSIAAGLAAYFALDPPAVAHAYAVQLDLGRSVQLTWDLTNPNDMDLNSVFLRIDGRNSQGTAQAKPSQLQWLHPHTLANGPHTAELSARNLNGASLRHAFTFEVDRPPAYMTVRQMPPAIPREKSPQLLLEVSLRDTLGLPVTDATSVKLEELGLTQLTDAGLARFYLKPEDLPDRLTLTAAGLRQTYELHFGSEDWHSLVVLNRSSKQPVANALITKNNTALGHTTPEGWFACMATDDRLTISAKGYASTSIVLRNPHSEVHLEALASGVLHNARIAIDPAHGGLNPGLSGPNGVRASDLNLDIAQRLAALLREAGARPVLTRNGDTAITNTQRIAPSRDSDIFVSISLGMPEAQARLLDNTGHARTLDGPFVAHYPTSRLGILLAQALAKQLQIETITPAVSYVIQQTACPAVLVSPGMVSLPATEHTFQSTAQRQSIAEGLYQGIIDYYQEREG